MLDLAFVSAIPEELIHLQEAFPNFHYFSLGIGNIEAGIHLQKILCHNPNIQEVIYIGSAGSYDPQICPVPSFAGGSSYFLIESSSLEGRSHIPDRMVVQSTPKQGEFFKKLMDILKLPLFPTNCPNHISLHEWNWKNGKKKDSIPILENMECFGISRVCELNSIGFSSIFSITNTVSQHGSQEWKKNFLPMASQLNQKIIKGFNTILGLEE